MSNENREVQPDRSVLTLPEAEQVAATLADVSAAGRPLADGLRAAASETAQRKVAAELQWLAAQVESGRSVEQALASQPSRFPGYVAGLVQAAPVGVWTVVLDAVRVESASRCCGLTRSPRYASAE